MSGTITADASCVSSLRDPADTASVYYARRHAFTLDAAATVSVSMGPAESRSYLVLSDESGVVLGRDRGVSSVCRPTYLSSICSDARAPALNYLLLPAGDYTVEATTGSPGQVGPYTVSVSWRAGDACERDLGGLDAVTSSLSASGTVAVDASCVSSLRDPADTASVYYARRHAFTLDAAATVSVSMGPAESRSYLVLSDESGVVLGRDRGVSSVCRPTYLSSICSDARAPALNYLLLPAGDYTVEATTGSPGQVGPYTVSVSWRAGDACERHLGGLDAVTSSLSASGTVAVDASCVSSLRDPADSTSVYYARRHAFTLDAAATVSVSMGPAESRSYLVLSDGSGVEVARGQGRDRSCYRGRCSAAQPARLNYLLLPAGDYTVEATTGSPGQVGPYTVSVSWRAGDACVRDLGGLDAVTSSLSASGTVAVDASCVSSLRDPADSTSVYYARRHAFTLHAAATVSVSMGPAESRSFVVLSDGSGVEVARGQGRDRSCYRGRCSAAQPARLNYLLLPAGDYTVEATTGSPGQVGPYTVSVQRAPVSREVTVSAASASEGDGSMVFVLEGSVPAGVAGSVVDVAPVSVWWATVSGSAAAGSDFRGSSGTLSIPADRSRATITVPITDDSTVETFESFSIELSRPSGAILIDTTAAATIFDDDGTVPGLSSIAPCDGIALSGSVAGVFDVAQSGYASDSHVFVDVDVTCGSPGDAVGLPVGVGVVSGPASSLGASSHCVTRVGTQQTTRSTGAGQGCVTYAVTRSISGDTAGRSTHLLRIPDTAVGQMHQLLVWIDADRDRAHDPGEPYQFMAADFVARSVGGATLADYGLPADFVVEIIPSHSTRIGRAGLDSELRLRLVSRSGAQAPIAEALVGVRVSAGPSGGTQADCVNTDGTTAGCRTDTNGEITVRYPVGTQGVSILRRSEDTIAVFGDPDQDGQRQFGAPTRFVSHPIAKTINYVALGDSYSAGENGRPELDGFVGVYENDLESADPQCRRWNKAYPYVVKDQFLDDVDLDIDVVFVTFACTGAVTYNIYDSRDPSGASEVEAHHLTDRPSPAAELDEPVYGRESPRGPLVLLHETHPNWEPRQAVSLAAVRSMASVDLVTITIGGNDVGFADVLKACTFPDSNAGQSLAESLFGARCRMVEAEVYDGVETRVSELAAESKRVAPGAAVFVLGYSPLAPQPMPCPLGAESCPELEMNRLIDQCQALSAAEIYASTVDIGVLPWPLKPLAYLAKWSPLGIGADVSRLTLAAETAGSTRIDHIEAQLLWSGAMRLNEAVRRGAVRAGVHFVDVTGRGQLAGSLESFVGHDPCSSEPWLNGFVVDAELRIASSGKSFHPNIAGHAAYARILEQYIRARIADDVELNEAGLPVNPGQAGS